MPNQIKIIHILNHSFPLLDGYASRSQSILIAQKKMKYHPVVLTSPKHEEDWKKKCSRKQVIDNIKFYRAGNNPLGRLPIIGELVQIAMVLLRLMQIIKIEKPSVIHAHSPVLNAISALIAGKWCGLPVVYEIRAFWEDAGVDQETYKQKSIKYNSVKFLETRACEKVSQVAVLCEGIKKDLISRGIPCHKITPVFNGINPENFKPSSPDEELRKQWNLSGKKVIGFIGSFYRYEGLDLLVKAFSEIAPDNPDLVLLLVGGGEMEDHLKNQVIDLGIVNRVILPGRIPHHRIQGVYALTDVLVYPRYSVRLTELVTPLKPLEAMAMGKAVIASDIGGHRELISHNETGILFRAGDPSSLANAILGVFKYDEKIKGLTSNGINYIENYKTWTKTTAAYKKIYDRLSCIESE